MDGPSMTDRFATAVSRHPTSPIVRSITLGPGCCHGDRFLVHLPGDGEDRADPDQFLADLDAPADVVEHVRELSAFAPQWYLGVDEASRRRSLRIYAAHAARPLVLGDEAPAIFVGIKWLSEEGSTILTFYRSTVATERALGAVSGPIREVLADLVLRADSWLLVEEPITSRSSWDVPTRRVSLADASPGILRIGEGFGVEQDVLSAALDAESTARVTRLAFGRGRAGDEFVTVYFTRDDETVGSWDRLTRRSGGTS